MITTDKLIICSSLTGNFHGKEANPNIPLQPDEIAELIAFLASDKASYITGQIIHINGGWYM